MIEIIIFTGGIVLVVVSMCYLMSFFAMAWNAVVKNVNKRVEEEVKSCFEAEFRRRKTEIDSLEAEIGKKKENLEEIRGVVGKKLDRDSISPISRFEAWPVLR